jgi:hypothetical protein
MALSDEDFSDFQLRSVEELLMDSIPQKSIAIYKKTWSIFRNFLGTNNDDIAPSEKNYIQFFDFMRRKKKYKGSTLWSVYSRLNGCHSRLYGEYFTYF